MRSEAFDFFRSQNAQRHKVLVSMAPIVEPPLTRFVTYQIGPWSIIKKYESICAEQGLGFHTFHFRINSLARLLLTVSHGGGVLERVCRSLNRPTSPA